MLVALLSPVGCSDDGGGGDPDGAPVPDLYHAELCDPIKREYAELLTEARRCDPEAEPSPCDTLVPKALEVCPSCSTYIVSSSAVHARMKQLISSWRQSCDLSDQIPCTAEQCPDLVSAECEGSGGEGTCHDLEL